MTIRPGASSTDIPLKQGLEQTATCIVIIILKGSTDIPLKQGLRLLVAGNEHQVTYCSTDIPLKQGLRQTVYALHCQDFLFY